MRMVQKIERQPATYAAPQVVEHTSIRFETMISAPTCTPGFVKIGNKYVRVDCIEHYQ